MDVDRGMALPGMKVGCHEQLQVELEITDLESRLENCLSLEQNKLERLSQDLPAMWVRPGAYHERCSTWAGFGLTKKYQA
jgi:hypothetical protein